MVITILFLWFLPFINTTNALKTSRIYTQHPILFIHDANSDCDAWDSVVNRFLNDGWPETLLFAYTLKNPSDTTNTAIIADSIQIEGWVDQILDQTGAEKIDIICHSMGGPSSRLYIKNRTGFTKVDDHVSLAGFHHGWNAIWVSQQDWYIPDTFIGESNGSLMIFLNNGDETPGGVLDTDTIGPRVCALSGIIFNGSHVPDNITWTSIYSPADMTSTPVNCSILDGAVNI